jgi:gamma-glutamyltranspeptidase/glutathione hydrolase
MTHYRRFGIVLLVLALGVMSGVRAQDRGDANAQASMKALRPSVPGVHGLVTSAHPLASMAGMRILLAGGNAFDAAVAVAAVLNVVEPQSSSIAGNGFATMFDKKTGQVHSLAMAGAAPKGLVVSAMTPETLNTGLNSAVVPGNIGGLIAMLDRFGTRSLAEVLAPAIEYAEQGHPANDGFAAGVRNGQKLLSRAPTSAALFMPGGKLPASGEIVRNPDFASTLKKMADAEQSAVKRGATRAAALKAARDRFYKGDMAEDIAGYFKANGGAMTLADLAAYEARWETPLHTTYRGYDVYSNASTSRGGFEVLMQLNLLEGFDLAGIKPGSPQALHLQAEAIKVAKSDIYKYVADPAFTKVPVAGLLSKSFAAERRKLIDPARAVAYPEAGNPAAFATTTSAQALSGNPKGLPPQLQESVDRGGPKGLPPRLQESVDRGGPKGLPPQLQESVDRGGNPSGLPMWPERYEPDPETTSFSIVDREGNAVAVTPTIGGGMGTGVVVGRTGLLFNNGLRLGSTAPYPDNVNYVRAGQIPLLNNSPVVVLKNGQLVLAIGTPGGETIGQTQFQGIVNVLDFGMSIQEAIEAPRFRLDPDPNFYKPAAKIVFEIERRVSPATVEALKAMGHTVNLLPEFTAGVGGMQGILIDQRTRTMTAGADPRRAGYAVGW